MTDFAGDREVFRRHFRGDRYPWVGEATVIDVEVVRSGSWIYKVRNCDRLGQDATAHAGDL